MQSRHPSQTSGNQRDAAHPPGQPGVPVHFSAELAAVGDQRTSVDTLRTIAMGVVGAAPSAALIKLHERKALKDSDAPLVNLFCESPNPGSRSAGMIVAASYPEIARTLPEHILRGEVEAFEAGKSSVGARATLAMVLAARGNDGIHLLTRLHNCAGSDEDRAVVMPSLLAAGANGGRVPLGAAPALHFGPAPSTGTAEGLVSVVKVSALMISPSPALQEMGLRAAFNLPERERQMLALSRGNEISRLAQGSPLSEVPRLARAFLVENGYLEFTSSSPEVRPWVAASLSDLIRSSLGFIQVEKELSAALREALPHQVESVANLARQAGANNVIGVLAKLGDLQNLPEHTAVQVTRLAAEARPAAFTILERALRDTRASVRTAAVQVVQDMRLNADTLDSLLRCTVFSHSDSAGTQSAGISIARHFAAQNNANMRPTLESFAPNICRFAQTPEDVAFAVSILRTGGHSGVQIADMLGRTIERVRSRATGELEQTQNVRLRAILGELSLIGPEANHVYTLVRDLGQTHRHLRSEISQTLAAVSPARARFGILAEVSIAAAAVVRQAFSGSVGASERPLKVAPLESARSLSQEAGSAASAEMNLEVNALRFARERLTYADVGGQGAPSSRALEISKSYTRYARAQPGSDEQLDQLTHAGISSVLLALRRLGVAPSPVCESQSWYAWDVAKQLYYLENPAESSPSYRLANPFIDALKRDEIIDRHLGWELAAAQRGDGLPESFWRSFQHSEQRLIRQILEEFLDRESPPSNELARLGRIVNDALARLSL